MIRYYDKKLRCEVFEENENTLTSEDERVSFFFEELPQGKELRFTADGLPSLVDYIPISQDTMDLQNKINEYKSYLYSTDHKFNVDYEPKEDEDLELIKAKRSEARKFIRDNK